MSEEKKIGNSLVKIVIDDISDMEVEAFVFYAKCDLQLGSGHGGAITIRGGPSIQKELNEIGKACLSQAVITEAGKLKAKKIIHAIGPTFQEEKTEEKLADTIKNTLKTAESAGIKEIVFPAMGTGFYGIPLDVSAKIVMNEVKNYLKNDSKIEKVTFCMNDNRELKGSKPTFDSL